MIDYNTRTIFTSEPLHSRTVPWVFENPLILLDYLQGQPRWAWIDPDETMIAWGNAAEIEGENLDIQLDQLRQGFQNDELRLFGGIPFDDQGAADPLWQGFSTSRFILPQYIYRQSAQNSNLTVISSEHQLPQIPFPDFFRKYSTAMPDAKLESLLSYTQWESMVHTVHRQTDAGYIQKVVFARTLAVKFKQRPSLVTAFSHLVERYPDTYRFYFEPSPGHVFLGATPELLLQVKKRQLETIALAGSAPRGKTVDEDLRLGSDLLADPKNRREQAIVVERICDDLRPLCSSFQLPEKPHLRRLPNIQHIETPIKAYLKRPGILSPAKALHPTPALAGQPRQAAMEMIRQYEPVPRGAYGAPVGWITPEGDGRLAVAIRSGIFQGSVGRLYAGAGLLAESDPQKEWDETALKFRPMLDALGLTEKA